MSIDVIIDDIESLLFFIPSFIMMPIMVIIFLLIVAACAFAIQKFFVRFLDRDEYLVVEGLTEQTIIEGPKIAFLSIWNKSSEVRKAVTLTRTQYCVIRNSMSGELRTEIGPKLVMLKPYDKILEDPKDTFRAKKRTALSLKANEYLRLLDQNTGKIRVIKGEKGCFVPIPDESMIDGGKQQAMNLQMFEYVKIQDQQTAAVRTVQGECLAWLGPHERYLGTKQKAIQVDNETAVLVRSQRDGQQELIKKKQLFVPSNEQEIVEIRKRQKLAVYEACIIRDETGQDIFYYGKNENQRSFFLPPHHDFVTLRWSRGRRRERRDLTIRIIDLRPMYMSFEFHCRTNDNVELILEGSFFWEIIDLEAMIQYTNDTTGDICNHARSRFIELVSKVTLKAFMEQFNEIAEQVHKSDDSDFFEQRGVKIHSLEVTGYQCANAGTAETLAEIIQETTNRINRLQQQESENEVQLKQIRGDIEEEKAQTELLEIQMANSNVKARMEGAAEAERVKSFFQSLQEEFPEMDRGSITRFWNTLRKQDALAAVASGNTKLYFTPTDVNLSIESHEHEHSSKSKGNEWVGASDSPSE